jgi:predicted RNA-binding Zn ribbon-like protein
LDLANTYYAVRGKLREGLSSAQDVGAWTAVVSPRLGGMELSAEELARTDEADRESFLELRSAIRGIAGDLAAGRNPAAEPVEALNRASALAPASPALKISQEGTLEKSVRSEHPAAAAALSALAGDAVDLFSGDRRALLRECRAPGCYLFFLKDHPRREWCTPACGMRVRASRAYYKRTHPEGGPPGLITVRDGPLSDEPAH